MVICEGRTPDCMFNSIQFPLIKLTLIELGGVGGHL